jgi:F0F1-type ATP synthase assembly protein I
MMFFKRDQTRVDPKERAIWGDLMAIGMVFPIAIVVGYLLGRWVGGLVGYPRTGMAVGLIWGIGSGFWELIKTTLRLNRLDAPPKPKDDEKGGHGPET